MSLEPLELGCLLVSERRRLMELAAELAPSPEEADAAVCRCLRTVWLGQADIHSRIHLIAKLYAQLGAELA